MVLVDGTDGITEKTGQTGTVYLSKNGTTQAQSTNSLVEVDSANLPGHYYVELTASELDTLGFLSVRYKAAGTAAFQWVGQVVADDPYINHSGPGMSGGSGRAASGLKQEEMIALAKMVWNVILRGKKTAKDVVLETMELAEEEIEFPEDTATPKVLAKIQAVVEDLAEREAVDPSDGIAALTKTVAGVTSGLSSLQKQLVPIARLEVTLGKLQQVVANPQTFQGIAGVVAELTPQIAAFKEALEDVRTTTGTFQELNDQAETLMSGLNEKIDTILDVERRFAALKTDESKEYLQKELDGLRTELRDGMKKLLLNVVDAKYKTLANIRN